MEKRRSQLTKRSFSNDPYDTGNGISTIQRVGSFELSPLSEELFSSNSDSVDLFEANGFPMASLSNKKVKKSIRSYFTRKVCLVLFLVILIVIYFGYAFDLKSYFLTAFHLTPDSQSNDYLRNRGIKHGSVLETYGKSESIKMKLKDKDKLGTREKLLLDGNNFANESPSDDLLVQLLAEQKEKISAKVRKIDDSTKPKPEEIINQVTKSQVDVFAERLRYMKQHDHTIMEQNATAIQSIREFQNVVRKYLVQTYGNDPYFLEMELTFPDSMLNEKETSKSGKIVIQLAPIDLVPYSVYYFLQTVENFKSGAFHRRAGHVLQAMVQPFRPGLAFQEYHPDFPHVKHTLGYAGRPGGPEFYISTVDNTQNHGPGSQGSKTEADSCFGKITEGLDVVQRMKKQPGAGPSGFINDAKNFIRISSLKLLEKSN